MILTIHTWFIELVRTVSVALRRGTNVRWRTWRTLVAYALEVPTSNPRAGRRFEPIQERELHADALKAVRGIPNAGRGVVVVPEFSGPLGIPDFTAFVGDVSRIRVRQRLDVAPISNEMESGIISAAHSRRASSTQAIAHSLGWPADMVSSYIKALKKKRALIELAPDRFVRPKPLQPGGRLYAVETKVSDWKSALRQVRTYRVWADSYVLVMGRLSERPQAALMAEVQQDQGGLMVSGQWVVRPKLGVVADRRRLQAWELFVDATRGGLGDPAL